MENARKTNLEDPRPVGHLSINSLHAGCRFVCGNVKNMKLFFTIQSAILRTTAPILFLFMVMHFSC